MADRPAGKKSESSSGIDHVAEPPADEGEDAAEPCDDAPHEEAVGDEPVDDDCGVGDDVLDARERRQSTVRKPAGPSDSRIERSDVVIEQSSVPPAPPTEPA